MKDKKILAVDLGEKKVGLAIAEAGLITPLCVLKNEKNLEYKILKIIEQEGIEAVVIGVSNANQEEEARCFGEKLAKLSSVLLFYEDENLTTKEAIAKMIEAGKKKKYRREKDHLFAAALILERFLEKHV